MTLDHYNPLSKYVQELKNLLFGSLLYIGTKITVMHIPLSVISYNRISKRSKNNSGLPNTKVIKTTIKLVITHGRYPVDWQSWFLYIHITTYLCLSLSPPNFLCGYLRANHYCNRSLMILLTVGGYFIYFILFISIWNNQLAMLLFTGVSWALEVTLGYWEKRHLSSEWRLSTEGVLIRRKGCWRFPI